MAAGRTIVVAIEEAAGGVAEAVGGRAEGDGVGVGRQQAAGGQEEEGQSGRVEDQ